MKGLSRCNTDRYADRGVRLIISLLLIVAAGLVTAAAPAGAAAGSDIVYRDKTVALPAKTFGQTLTVRCPRGSVVVGGGSFNGGVFGGSTLLGSYPVDGDDRDKDPDDGWRSVANNPTKTKYTLSTFVACRYGAGVTYQSSFGDLEPLERERGAAYCQSGDSIVGGGGRIAPTNRRAHLEGSHPVDDQTDGDASPDNGWNVAVSNPSQTKVTLRTWAICANETVSYVPDPRLVPANTASTITTLCPAGTESSGGGFISQLGRPFVLVMTKPYDTTDSNNVRYNGWSVTAYNTASVAENINVIAICMYP